MHNDRVLIVLDMPCSCMAVVGVAVIGVVVVVVVVVEFSSVI